jgi:tRNA threonylcarbamoyladenosine biosynthesis protein TsaB
MALILNIDTTTDIGSVCISKDKQVLAIENGSTRYSHAKETTILIESCLKSAAISLNDLDAVAISKGPGSYTSLRIGTSIAKGICYALNKPLIAVDTLASLAMASSKVEKGDLYAPMIDARRMEVYTALYDSAQQNIEAVQALILDEDSFKTALQEQKRIVLSGNGCEKIKKVKKHPSLLFTNILCHATHLVPLAYKAFTNATFESVAYFEPMYLKPPNITTPKKVL